MGRRKLSQDVTVEEMLRLRNEPYCLINMEIAKRLDVSHMTVYKYIGAQGARKCKKAVEERHEQKQYQRIFDNAQSVARLTSGSRTYEWDHSACTVNIAGLDGLKTSSDELRSIINELTYFVHLIQKKGEENNAF